MPDPRIALIEAARRLHEMGCLPASDGNFSARVDRKLFWITQSGIEKGRASIDDFILIDDAGRAIEGHGKPSSEWRLHIAIYEHRDEVNSILHAHPPYLTAFAAAHKVPDTAILAEAELTIGGICLVRHAQPGTAALATEIVTCTVKPGIYLLENHGIVAVGRETTQAVHRLERAEFLVKVSLLAQEIGGAVPLSRDQVAELRERRAK